MLTKIERGTPDCRESPDRTVQPRKNWATGAVGYFAYGDCLVQVPGNGSSRERGTLLSVWVCFYSQGLSELISIHQRLKEMMTN